MHHEGKRVRRREGQGRPANSRLFLLIAAVVLVLMGLRLILDTARPVDGQEADASGVVSELPDRSAQEPPVKREPTREEKLEHIRTSGEYTEMLIKFAENYPEPLDFVYKYPEFKDYRPDFDLTAEAQSQEVPLLLQWDDRWGYASYAGGLMGYAGCGPTSLSMAALYLTHDPEQTPLKAAAIAEEQKYCSEGGGSNWTLISEGSRLMGMDAKALPLDRGVMERALDQGKPIILSVGPGDFTRSGHYLVAVGYEEEGFRVNDPNSRANSAKCWPYDQLKGQIRNLWAMSAL